MAGGNPSVPAAVLRRFLCRGCLRKAAGRQARLLSTVPTVPFRKQLKDEARQRRISDGAAEPSRQRASDTATENWELTVGIEVHAQLNTRHKLFSKAATSFNDPANSHVAFVDAAFPGAQPIFQRETLVPALRAAIALGCSVNRKSAFDRKHYFYRDQPAGYQITQYYQPLAKDGFITLYEYDGIAPEDGKEVRVGIKQIQMEQDTAKTIHQPPSTYLLDFNRVSHPLIEIITLPHIHHPATAAACVRKIQAILNAVNAAVLGMELGGLRADVNVSVRPKNQPEEQGVGAKYHGITGLGQRTEIKNLSSFKAVEDAVKAERDRQIRVLEAGGVIEGETRGWALGSTETRKLRGKEGEVDYRYMPDPDLGPVVIAKDLIDHIKHSLPPLPDDRFKVLTSSDLHYNLTPKDAKTLLNLDDGDRIEYYKNVADEIRRRLLGSERGDGGGGGGGRSFTVNDEAVTKVGKMTGNWLLHELGGLLATSGTTWEENPVDETSLADILTFLSLRKITGTTAKTLLSLKFYGSDSRPIPQIISEDKLALQPLSEDELRDLANEVMRGNEKMVRAVREKGEVGKLGWFIGQMVKRGGGGRVEAQEAERVVREILGVGLARRS
ncbi:hypothetical protein GP486_005981 [Trichoglossum hirsutum]|uniref:Glutamyl-tRNA(Gln) amidotransferase subunit B, mitochondrial n=1 Tax=Trichoglossum hirsutum TaxID=265104 RepID=A0A9P8L864_9PEZI|nr:hypothetical protein GP486_005981 [Trichoglossum hirsutum]